MFSLRHATTSTDRDPGTSPTKGGVDVAPELSIRPCHLFIAVGLGESFKLSILHELSSGRKMNGPFVPGFIRYH